MALGDTVYDRAKKTGYMLGSKHRYENAFEEGAEPEAPEGQSAAEDAPPNLRDAGAAPDTCADCAHSEPGEGEGLICKLHGDYPVMSSQVCDDFASEGEEGIAPGGGGMEDILSAARARLAGGGPA